MSSALREEMGELMKSGATNEERERREALVRFYAELSGSPKLFFTYHPA